MNIGINKRLHILEEAQVGENAFFPVLGYADVDKLDKRALNPKSTILILSADEENPFIRQAVAQKLDALRLGNNQPLFTDHPKTDVQEWAL